MLVEPFLQAGLEVGASERAQLGRPRGLLTGSCVERTEDLRRHVEAVEPAVGVLEPRERVAQLVGGPPRRRRRVVQLVGHPGDEGAEGGHLLGLAQGPLGLLLGAHVGSEDEHQRGAGVVPMREDVLLLADPRLDVDDVRGLLERLPRLQVDRRAEVGPEAADELLTEDQACRGVRHQNGAVGVHPEHRPRVHLREPGHFGQPGRLLGQPLLDAAPLGDVGQDQCEPVRTVEGSVGSSAGSAASTGSTMASVSQRPARTRRTQPIAALNAHQLPTAPNRPASSLACHKRSRTTAVRWDGPDAVA